MDEKAAIEEVENGRQLSFGHYDEAVAKHGDRALAYIGDERIPLTDEEVSSSLQCLIVD